MDDNSLSDLKKFITLTVSEQISDVRDDIKKLDEKLTTKIDDISHSVAEAIEDNSEAVDTQLKGHEERIDRLEQKTA
jgi:hypothetical protein